MHPYFQVIRPISFHILGAAKLKAMAMLSAGGTNTLTCRTVCRDYCQSAHTNMP